ncbi:MAG: hypothetical protein CSA52_01400 [Gammaproteobacteria bacterium]|nr:MAG: hypothetical protein CSB48_09910 [Pseudomonadota bacterium]PIE38733.1 MAG: hypothetical protein CSA52_01400 [Gammaproteobacteria bacterium]
MYHWIKRLILLFELAIINSTSLFSKIPLLQYLHRTVTANVEVLSPEGSDAFSFSVRFKTPYFHLPLEIAKTQVGHESDTNAFQPSAFLFFDWQSWQHITGKIKWLGERSKRIDGKKTEVITGFVYEANIADQSSRHLGLRLAEGVEGTVRVLGKRTFKSMVFKPAFWMFEPMDYRYNLIHINDIKQMTLIVSLSEMGSGNPELYHNAVARIEEWISLTVKRNNPESVMLVFLRHVRNWGPLGMPPLFQGLCEILGNMGVADQEKLLYDFYADNWGARNNPNGRLLVVKTLEAMGTKKAGAALALIFEYIQNQPVHADELAMVQQAIESVSQVTGDKK